MSLSVPQDQPPRSGDVVESPNGRARRPAPKRQARFRRRLTAAVVDPIEPRLLLTGVNFLAAPQSFPIPGSNAFPVMVSDINGDGFPDVLTAGQYHNAAKTAGTQGGLIATLSGNGDGTLFAAQ